MREAFETCNMANPAEESGSSGDDEMITAETLRAMD